MLNSLETKIYLSIIYSAKKVALTVEKWFKKQNDITQIIILGVLLLVFFTVGYFYVKAINKIASNYFSILGEILSKYGL